MNNAQEPLLEVLRDARALLARPENDFAWSTWAGSTEALAELDGLIAHVEAGRKFEGAALTVLFLPTGDLQEVSLSSGWGDEFCRVADRFDLAYARYFAG